jgi:ADP-ribose pyrophosphatase
MTIHASYEKTIKSETLYEGKILTLRKEAVRLANGQVGQREIVDHGPAVVVLPFTEPDQVFLIKQYRKAVDQVLIEAPAGLINPNEAPFAAAKRELREETGFEADTWQKVGEAYPTPGFCNEYMYFYLASGLVKGEQDCDDDEFVEVFPMTIQELGRRVQDGTLNDVKTILMYFYLKQYLLESGGVR